MKKNISINISGIIFHIEEDGYDSLRKYLDSINKYFGSFEDSSEILADIENRIAEIFLTKLSEGKQVITHEDVNGLIATMGNVSDFKAAEEQEAANEQPKTESGNQERASAYSIPSGNKKLVRDQKRKILGGVCAGLGYYFNIDPVWPRVLIALLVLGSYGSLLLVYILLWILLPASEDLEETAVKKMYRNPEKKVLGGVASGIAAFFGVDITVVRLIFVILFLFAGLGVVVYIILWGVLPEAKSITEKMEMQGEPVTLSNIESTVKKNLNERETEESPLAKIVLFPFRLIATVITALSKAIGPIVRVFFELIRVVIGLAIFITGLALLISVVVAFGVFFGLFSASVLPEYWGNPQDFSLPLDAFRHTIPVWSMIAAFVVAFIPSLCILLSGSSILSKRSMFNAGIGWSLGGLFFIAILILSFTVPKIIYSFKEDGEYKTEKTFDLKGKTGIFKVNETGLQSYHHTDLTIKGYDGKEMKLVQRFSAQGSTRKKGAENAQMVTYEVIQQDSVFTFDSNLTFKKDAQFYVQRLDMELFIPYGSTFVIEEEMWRLIDNNSWDYDGYRDSNFDKTWKMTEKGLECINCTEPTETKAIELKDQYGLTDFNEIDLKGIFDLVIQEGDAYSVQLDGPEREKKKYEVSTSGETLEIDYNSNNKTFWEGKLNTANAVTITVTLPHLRKLKVKGAGKLRVSGFDEDDMEFELLGAMVGDANVKAHNLTVDLSGPMIFELDGEGSFLQADVKNLAQLKAGQYVVDHAVIEAKNIGTVRVNATNTVEIDADLVSSVKYEGSPEVIRKN
jgi:phage shock protein PspC (stress-responsive transcriptional regulator)